MVTARKVEKSLGGSQTNAAAARIGAPVLKVDDGLRDVRVEHKLENS